ncbi:MAG: ABC transporter permease subunit [Reyranella sp.]|uniref:ABC transporter permease subunit n=1 Tax=Reyranella sp. TaxID=1929291 RepID=UPI0012009014|nr:ABC transporter permease subunit [Reyranella sp.]TAJ97233.1 MAG: ABC transporter permease subunit [Reyranella sp.]TBR29695.1 MAG: ABC transporter permease subunit [Reyranella sp.]
MRFVIGLPFLWLGIFFLLPCLLVLAISLGTYAPDSVPPVELGLSIKSFALLFSDGLYLAAWLSSLRIAATSTLVALLLGYPMAYAIARTAPNRRPLLLMLVVLPFWTSFLIRIYAWMGLLADNGLIDQFLRWSGLVSNPGTILGTEWAVHLGIVYAYLPFMVLPLYATLEKLDDSLLEAAADLGAKPLAAFFTVTLPLSLPGIVAGCLLVFIPAVGEFVIPDLLGGTETLMIGKVLWDEFFTNGDWPLASAVAVCLLVLLVGPIAIFQRNQARSLEKRT